jgi:hypothetical protein
MKATEELINSIKNNKFAVPIILISAVIILSLFVSFKATGYSVYSNQLDDCNAEVSTYEEEVESLKTDVAKLTTDLEVSKDKVSEKDDTITDLKQDILSVEADQEKSVDRYNTLIEKFDLIVDNSATNICCKRKVDDPTINSFNIEDNELVCTTGGTFDLDCPSL